MVEINAEDADLLRRIDTRLTEIEAERTDLGTNAEERAMLDAEKLALEKEGADILSESKEKADYKDGNGNIDGGGCARRICASFHRGGESSQSDGRE